jgi:hypothetical protein
MPPLFALFHLNLAYSSVATADHREIVARAYTPLLDLVEELDLPLGLELSGWTLGRLQRLAPAWVARLARLLAAGRCELIGSGYVQLIGPLAPPAVHTWNQRLGLADYQALLGRRPELVLVNEMAYSPSLVDLYQAAGYRGLIMDADNVQLAIGEDTPLPTHARGPGGAELPVLWTDSLLFQRLQRYTHGDITRTDYLACLERHAGQVCRPLSLYANDAEVFDYRPGRFPEEPGVHPEGEWRRLAQLFRELLGDGHAWYAPSAALAASLRPARRGPLNSIAQPLPVKKQAKYNIARWAVTGRNDLWLNTLAHRLARPLADPGAGPALARRVCRLWASDLRTHITPERWTAARTLARRLARLQGRSDRFTEPPRQPWGAGDTTGPFVLTRDPEGLYLDIAGPGLHLSLNLRRGLAIRSLGFAGHGFAPLLGTLPQGFFPGIALGADYYSGHLVLELPAEHRRVTDLQRCRPLIWWHRGQLHLQATLATSRGPLIKTLTLDPEQPRLGLACHFPGWQRPHGSLRLGAATLLPGGLGPKLSLLCHHGGPLPERLPLDRPCEHGAPASALVSCSAGFGASNGTLVLEDGRRRLCLTWDPARCAAFPLLLHRPASPMALTRVFLSLAELDDTARPEGSLPPLELGYTPD